MSCVTDPVNCLFSLTIYPNIEPVWGKMRCQVISSVRLDNLPHILTQKSSIWGDTVSENNTLKGSVTHGIFFHPRRIQRTGYKWYDAWVICINRLLQCCVDICRKFRTFSHQMDPANLIHSGGLVQCLPADDGLVVITARTSAGIILTLCAVL